MKNLIILFIVGCVFIMSSSALARPTGRKSKPAPSPEAVTNAPAGDEAVSTGGQDEDFIQQLPSYLKEYKAGTSSEDIRKESDRQKTAWETYIKDHKDADTELYYDEKGNRIADKKNTRKVLFTEQKPIFYDCEKPGTDEKPAQDCRPHIFYEPILSKYRKSTPSVTVGPGIVSQTGDQTGAVIHASVQLKNPGGGIAPRSSIGAGFTTSAGAHGDSASGFVVDGWIKDLGGDFYCDHTNAKNPVCLRLKVDAEGSVDAGTVSTKGPKGDQIWGFWADAGAEVKVLWITDNGAYCAIALGVIGGGTYTTKLRKGGKDVSGAGPGGALEGGCFSSRFDFSGGFKAIQNLYQTNENPKVLGQVDAEVVYHVIRFDKEIGFGLDVPLAAQATGVYGSVVNDNPAVPAMDASMPAGPKPAGVEVEGQGTLGVRVTF